MDILVSIQKFYTDLIFHGEKPLEFRNRVGKDLCEGSKIYFYESKGTGAGKVVGKATISKIIDMADNKPKLGTYFLLPYYVKIYGTDEEKRTVEKAMKVNLTKYDNSLVLNYLFNDEALDYMLKTNSPPSSSWRDKYSSTPDGIRLMNDWNQKENDLTSKCDMWGSMIEFYDRDDESFWHYAMELSDIVKYDEPMNISDFTGRNGKPLMKAPQSWCYVV